jgi:hypothetical protein
VVPTIKENEYETFELPVCMKHYVKIILGFTLRNMELMGAQYIAKEDAYFQHIYK